MVITRLGQGVDATGRLDPAAIERTVEVLRGYKAAMDRHGVSEVRMTATSAARDAANSDDFFDAAEEAVGVRHELISRDEAGKLSFAGAAAAMNPEDRPLLVADHVGGSPACSARPPRVQAARSPDT